MRVVRILVAAALFLVCSVAVAPSPALSEPGINRDALAIDCEVSAEAEGSTTDFLIFHWYRGLGRGTLSCSTTAPASAITIQTELIPSGGDADVTACQNRYNCYVDADAKGPKDTYNCVFVEAAGAAAGKAFQQTTDYDYDCNQIL